MNRCGIFVFYDPEGIVGEYVIFLLESLKPYLDKLILLVNGEIRSDEKENLYKYADYIYERKNIGFDAGAYKDFFQMHTQSIFLEEFDELLMINNSFYGPFYSWQKLFKDMECENIDFWGLSRQEMLSYEDFNIPEHLQSYFFCIKKKMFLHSCFKEFWEKLTYPSTFEEAVKKYEYLFTQYFVKYGFSYTSWADVQNLKLGKKENTSSDNNHSLIINLNFPVLRRKLCEVSRYSQLQYSIEYIKNNIKYPLHFIYDDMKRRENIGSVEFSSDSLLIFAKKFKNIYLYGYGKYAKNLTKFFEDNGIKIVGYVVSNKIQRTEDNIFYINNFSLSKDDGMVIALGKINYLQIVENLVGYEKSHIYIPNYK